MCLRPPVRDLPRAPFLESYRPPPWLISGHIKVKCYVLCAPFFPPHLWSHSSKFPPKPRAKCHPLSLYFVAMLSFTWTGLILRECLSSNETIIHTRTLSLRVYTPPREHFIHPALHFGDSHYLPLTANMARTYTSDAMSTKEEAKLHLFWAKHFEKSEGSASMKRWNKCTDTASHRPWLMNGEICGSNMRLVLASRLFFKEK